MSIDSGVIDLLLTVCVILTFCLIHGIEKRAIFWLNILLETSNEVVNVCAFFKFFERNYSGNER